MKLLRMTQLFCIVGICVLVLVGCASLSSDTRAITGKSVQIETAATNGGLVSAEPFYLKTGTECSQTLSLATIPLLSVRVNTRVLAESGYEQWQRNRLKQTHDVQAVKIRFTLPGSNEIQSGMLYLPAAQKDKQVPITWIVYTKGTELKRSQVPSRNASYESGVAESLAAIGNAVWMPDYEGMGDNPGIQAYCVPKSLAASAIDGLRAVRSFVGDLSGAYSETGNLYIMGYSEGGLGAMAATRDAVSRPDAVAGLTLKAAYPMGAPLNLMIGVDQLKNQPDPLLLRPEFQILLVLGWARAYPDLVHPEEILKPEILTLARKVFSADLSGGEISSAIADACKKAKGKVLSSDIFLADFLQTLAQNPESLPYYRAQINERLDQWLPPVDLPLVLAATPDDKIVPPGNSSMAYEWITAKAPQSKIQLLKLASDAHFTAGAEALLWAIMDIDRRESASNSGKLVSSNIRG